MAKQWWWKCLLCGALLADLETNAGKPFDKFKAHGMRDHGLSRQDIEVAKSRMRIAHAWQLPDGRFWLERKEFPG